MDEVEEAAGLAGDDVFEVDAGAVDGQHITLVVAGGAHQSAPDHRAVQRDRLAVATKRQGVLAPDFEGVAGLDRHAVEAHVDHPGVGGEKKLPAHTRHLVLV